MTSVVAPVGPCIQLCVCICNQLLSAKYNRHECQSLHGVVWSIRNYLDQLMPSRMSAAGQQALVDVRETLTKAQALVSKVVNMGPLVSLILASDIRMKFQLINRDLLNQFQVLGLGEQLMSVNKGQLDELTETMQRINSTLFAEQEHLSNKLFETAAAGQRKQSHPGLLQRALLDQLQQLPEVVSLTPEELPAELQALQLAALYGTYLGEGEVKQKLLGDKTEEFLVEQLCAALAPKACLANQPLTSPAAPDFPPGYVCPIGLTLMSKPVMLTETGQTYEEANIRRWLDMHSTCPASGKQLVMSPPQLVPNYNLQQSIAHWAEERGVQVPAPPEYSSLGLDGPPATDGKLGEELNRLRGQNVNAGWGAAAGEGLVDLGKTGVLGGGPGCRGLSTSAGMTGNRPVEAELGRRGASKSTLPSSGSGSIRTEFLAPRVSGSGFGVGAASSSDGKLLSPFTAPTGAQAGRAAYLAEDTTGTIDVQAQDQETKLNSVKAAITAAGAGGAVKGAAEGERCPTEPVPGAPGGCGNGEKESTVINIRGEHESRHSLTFKRHPFWWALGLIITVQVISAGIGVAVHFVNRARAHATSAAPPPAATAVGTLVAGAAVPVAAETSSAPAGRPPNPAADPLTQSPPTATPQEVATAPTAAPAGITAASAPVAAAPTGATSSAAEESPAGAIAAPVAEAPTGSTAAAAAAAEGSPAGAIAAPAPVTAAPTGATAAAEEEEPAAAAPTGATAAAGVRMSGASEVTQPAGAVRAAPHVSAPSPTASAGSSAGLPLAASSTAGGAPKPEANPGAHATVAADGSCDWPGHCRGDRCQKDGDCAGRLQCSAAKKCCDGSIPGSCAVKGCEWVDHCKGDPCSDENDCDGNLVCVKGKCGKAS